VNKNRIRRLRWTVLALGACLVLAGCGSTTPTTTPEPTSAASPETTPSPTPTATPTPEATPTPAATPTPEATPTPAATPAPTASAGSPAAACSGTQKTKDLWAEAAAKELFPVYCPVLPPDYWAEMGQYLLPDGGLVIFMYTNARGYMVQIVEGNICRGAGCLLPGPSLGQIMFGDRVGTLYSLSVISAGLALAPASPNAWLVHVRVSDTRSYMMVAVGISKASFIKMAAAVVKVPKS
jgi:hypothetical protein